MSGSSGLGGDGKPQQTLAVAISFGERGEAAGGTEAIGLRNVDHASPECHTNFVRHDDST
jgi:hypothetical protein